MAGIRTAFFSFFVNCLPLGRAEGGGAGKLGVVDVEACSICSASRSRAFASSVVRLLLLVAEPSSI